MNAPVYPSRLEIQSALFIARAMLIVPVRVDIDITREDLDAGALDVIEVTMRRLKGDESALFGRRTSEILAWLQTAAVLGMLAENGE